MNPGDDNTRAFFAWTNDILHLLPPKMTMHEALLIFERRQRELKELEEEEKNK